MKKWLCALVVLALMAGGFAFAETEAIERFLDTWVSGGHAVEIWQEDGGALSCYVMADDGAVCEFSHCRYDADSDSLICEGGEKVEYTYDESINDYHSSVLESSLSVTFAFDADGAALTMNDGKEIIALKRLAEEEEDAYNASRLFLGEWVCDRAKIDIDELSDGSFFVEVTWANSASETVEWMYPCAYDDGEKLLFNFDPGVKSTVQFDETGAAVDVITEYDDGEVTFTIDGDDMLIWNDKKENAGDGMRFERVPVIEAEVSPSIEDGRFVVRIPVAGEDDAWIASDLTEGEALVHLDSEEILDGIFTARYDAALDGDATVCVKHMKFGVCNELYTWVIRVTNGMVSEIVDEVHMQSPDAYWLDTQVSGEWQINDDIMAGMTIVRRDDDVWSLQIATAYPQVYVLRANLYYDCALDCFVYSDGTFYRSEITESPEIVIGDVVATDAQGTLTRVTGADGGVELEWYNALSPDETVRFSRPESWYGNLIRPMNETIDLNDGQYPVAFDRANIADGVISEVHFFTVDCYDIVDIASMTASDTLIIEGNAIRIESITDDEYGDKRINGGFDEGGYTLHAFDESNCWMAVGEDDYHTYTERAVQAVTLGDAVMFTDAWNIEADPVTAEGIEAVTEAILSSDNDSFFEYNTTLRLEGGKVAEINRRFIP